MVYVYNGYVVKRKTDDPSIHVKKEKRLNEISEDGPN
jgi:hypothetical protein